ncbi:O-antigen ligase family protein [Oligoflexus tunisiensis]|uniref:O-antigen ligase family protein n=1 Tax=Oligoflexus tunisiensis TaxID=708132 RepID=UPI001C4070B2|nr:O-antigen ligase family protein [Oligoflexus tunisiensis]
MPFALLGARALQSGGIYILGILAPLLLLHRRARAGAARFPWTRVGFLLAAAYALFPLNNIILWLRQPKEIDSSILSSNLSSAVLVSGVMMLLIGVLDKRPIISPNDSSGAKTTLMESFHKGVVWASLLFGLYLLVQFFSGFDFFSQYAFREDRRFLNGTYRVTGFTSHPVTMAGVSLAFFAYYGTLAAKNRDTRAFLVSGAHLVFILMTGCRSPALTAGAIGMLLPLFAGSEFSRKQRLAWGFAVLAASVMLGFHLGIWERFKELPMQLETTGLADARIVFWKVHWAMFLDSPWLGQGAYWMDQAIRLDYYEKLGFGDFPRKYNSHNLFLEILSTVGIVGALCLFILGFLLVRGIKEYLNQHSSRELKLAFSCFSVAFFANLLHGLTENTYFDAPIAYVYIGFLWVLTWAGVAERLDSR